MSGEADLFPAQSRSPWSRIVTQFFSRNKKSLSSRLQNWQRVAEHIKTRDSIHLLTVHIQSRTSARSLFQSPAWLDINSIQSGHSYDSLQFMIDEISKESEKSMPIINLEPWYEGIRDSFYGRDQLVAHWACMLSGAAGHSYEAHGIWQMADGDDFQGHWGNSNWNKSMKFEGATLVGSAVKQIREIWHKHTVSSDLDKLVPDDIMAKISPHMK